MRKAVFLLIMMYFPLLQAQTITFKGCLALFDDQDYVFAQSGTDATGRNIFVTTPVDPGQVCGGLGTCEFKLQWSVVNSRWEFLADEGNGTFAAPHLVYSNTEASTPNPPSLNLGTWVENTVLTNNECGGNLSSGNSTLTGDVQDAVLSNDDFAFDASIVLYPNPSKDSFSVQSVSPIKNITIWNVQGQKIAYQDVAGPVDVSGLSAGMYLIKITSDRGFKVVNFVKN